MLRTPAAISLIALAAILSTPAPLVAQAPPSRTTATVDPALEAAQKAFDALPEAERKAIQDDLIWASDFTATTSGSHGKRTHDAIVAFQKGHGLTANGILDGTGRRMLTEQAGKSRQAARYAMVTDARTGSAIGIAGAILSKKENVQSGGTRWSSGNGSVLLETLIEPGTNEADLKAAFERHLNAPVPGRKVSYKLLRPDFFVLSGEAGPRSFYMRFAPTAAGLRGYILSYPTTQAKDMTRLVIAAANSFQPVAAPVAARPATSALATVSPKPTLESDWPAGLFQNGIVIAPNKVLTVANAQACQDIRINGKPVTMDKSDSRTGLVLLNADTGKAPALTISGQPPSGDASDVLVVGFQSDGPRAQLTVTPAQLLENGRITAPLPRTAGGSAVFDRRGNVIGLVGAVPPKVRQVAGIVIAQSLGFLGAKDLIAISVATAKASPDTQTLSAGAISSLAGASMISLTCASPLKWQP